MNYVAPVKDMLFTLEHVAGLAELTRLPGLGEAGIDTARVVLEHTEPAHVVLHQDSPGKHMTVRCGPTGRNSPVR